MWAEGNQKHALGKSLANADNEQIVEKLIKIPTDPIKIPTDPIKIPTDAI